MRTPWPATAPPGAPPAHGAPARFGVPERLERAPERFDGGFEVVRSRAESRVRCSGERIPRRARRSASRRGAFAEAVLFGELAGFSPYVFCVTGLRNGARFALRASRAARSASACFTEGSAMGSSSIACDGINCFAGETVPSQRCRTASCTDQPEGHETDGDVVPLGQCADRARGRSTGRRS